MPRSRRFWGGLACLFLLTAGCQGPWSAFGIGAIEVYRTAIRPTYPARCRFHPTCSEFAAQSIRRFGLLGGVSMAADRILRCHPLADGLYPELAGGRGGPWRLDPVPGETAAARPRPLLGLALTPDEWQQMTFARSLDAAGEHDRAATEWLRFVSLFPHSSQAEAVRIRLGKSLYLAGEAEPALRAWEEVKDPAYAFRAGLYRAQALEALDRAAEAEIQLSALENMIRHPEESAAWSFIRALTAIRRGDRRAPEALRAAAEAMFAASATSEARAYFIERADALEALPEPSVGLAVALSAVVPGAGHAYAGRWQDGIFAFAVNLLFLGGSALAAYYEEPVTAGALGFFGLVFYSGNLYGAARAAEATSRGARQAFAQDAAYAAEVEGWLAPDWILGPP